MPMIESTWFVTDEVDDLRVRLLGYPGPGETAADGYVADFSHAHRLAICVQALPRPILFDMSTGFVNLPFTPGRPTGDYSFGAEGTSFRFGVRNLPVVCTAGLTPFGGVILALHAAPGHLFTAARPRF